MVLHRFIQYCLLIWSDWFAFYVPINDNYRLFWLSSSDIFSIFFFFKTVEREDSGKICGKFEKNFNSKAERYHPALLALTWRSKDQIWLFRTMLKVHSLWDAESKCRWAAWPQYNWFNPKLSHPLSLPLSGLLAHRKKFIWAKISPRKMHKFAHTVHLVWITRVTVCTV